MGIFDYFTKQSVLRKIERIQGLTTKQLIRIRSNIKDGKDSCADEKHIKIPSLNISFENSVFGVSEEQIEKTEPKYIRLCEKYKHNPEEVLKIVVDWCDFLNNCEDLIFGAQMKNAAADERGYENAQKDQDEAILKMKEIQKRFDKLLKD